MYLTYKYVNVLWNLTYLPNTLDQYESVNVLYTRMFTLTYCYIVCRMCHALI